MILPSAGNYGKCSLFAIEGKTMGLDLIPAPLHAKYQLAEYDHACAILARDFPTEFQDILDCLGGFVLKKTAILTPGP